ncbi:hypothetical protein GVN24_25520 [Rhizobium sp. CRIBSB]|nr:hypothetical protein [Rhizobium sp. CRIBSB]
MDRRTLIAAGTLAALSGVATGANARTSGGGGGGAPATVNINGLGLPVIAGGRLRNYVFVTLRLHLGASANAEAVRRKEAWFRDSLVKAAHRAPFTVANDWTRLDANALSASLVRSAAAIAGPGAVTRVEVVTQAPRRQTGVRTG